MTNYLQEHLVKVWHKVLHNIQISNKFDEAVFDTYIKESTLYEINEDSVATIVVPYLVNKNFLSSLSNLNYIQEQLSIVSETPITAHICVKSEIKSLEEEKSVVRTAAKFENHLSNEYDFSNFVVGTCNKEAQVAAYHCAESPSRFINPLFIYGNSGLGKTHLLNAIGNFVKENYPEKKILYISTTDFITLIHDSFKNKTADDIKDRISQLDYLLIDDIQRIASSPGSQEMFFELYNRLIAQNKQIVLTSDLHPNELKNIENRLVSRFSSGLSVCINSPELETSIRILEMKMEGRQNESLIISHDVLEYIASKFSKDIRKLEGALNELFFKSIIYNVSDITVKFAEEVFKENPTIKQEEKINPARIKKCVCEFYGLTKTQIESKSRTANIANARHIAIYLCRKHLDLPFAKIGFEFGNRDHSTIMSSYDKICKMIKEKSSFKEAVIKIENKLGIKY
ncbi:MAG: chromosomal replication initiator protein DnaA [Erysipelotrichaceae bacterium]